VAPAQELEVHLAQPSVTDWVVLAVGYFVISAAALAGLWLYLAWKVPVLNPPAQVAMPVHPIV
jgi:hypothetical protein